MARLPNKCLHVMVDGSPCGSPAVRHYRFCYHHKRQREQLLELNTDRARNSCNAPFKMPILEDVDSIQSLLAQVTQLLAAGQISHKTASLMLYSLQIAAMNLKQSSFEPDEEAAGSLRVSSKQAITRPSAPSGMTKRLKAAPPLNTIAVWRGETNEQS